MLFKQIVSRDKVMKHGKAGYFHVDFRVYKAALQHAAITQLTILCGNDLQQKICAKSPCLDGMFYTNS